MANIPSTLRYVTDGIRSLFNSSPLTIFSGRGGGGGYYPVRASQIPSARFNWISEAGDFRQNPIVALGLDWINRNATSVPLELWYKTRRGAEVRIDNHPLLDLLCNPNPVYSGNALMQAAITDIICVGNGFWALVPNYGGTVGELYWLDGRYMSPDFPTDGSIYLNSWKYIPASTGKPEIFDPSTIIDFKRGLDPWNDRLGYSPLLACCREIALINMMAGYTASILKNIGVTNLVMAPMGEVPMSPDQAAALKYEIMQAIGLDNKGTPLVIRQPIKTENIGTKPSELMMPEIDSGAVSRICSALGLSPMLLGLPDDSRTYTNYRESQRAAWINSIIPLHELLKTSIEKKLLPIYDPSGRFHLRWNYSNVEALSDDKKELSEMASKLYDIGIATLNEAREMMKLEPREDGDRFKSDISAKAEIDKAMGLSLAIPQESGEEDEEAA